MSDPMIRFETQLSELYPCRSSTLDYVREHSRLIHLQGDEAFPRTENQLLFLAHGLIKEYNVQRRSFPSVVAFYWKNHFLYTHARNKVRYLKAIIPTDLIVLDARSDGFQERFDLLEVIQAVIMQQESSAHFRQLVLEKRLSGDRLALFVERYQPILPYLNRRDMARYLQLSYHQMGRSIRNL